MEFSKEQFLQKYHAVGEFMETHYFAEFMKDVANDELMEKIRFCNDVLRIPPISVYVRYRSDLYTCELKDWEKRSLGACFGYLYKYGAYAHLYGQDSGVSTTSTHSLTTISKATYFRRRGI